MNIISLTKLLLLSAGIIGIGFFATQAAAQEATEVMQLRRLLEAHQKQLVAQQRQIENQQKLFDAQSKLIQDLRAQMRSVMKNTNPGEVAATGQNPTEEHSASNVKVATYGDDEQTRLEISGFVNRAVNVVDDGKSTQSYFVDNDNAESRVNIVGTRKATEDLTIGSRLELTIAPNKAGEVNQNDEETNNIFDQRITEATLDSKRFGKLSLGKGHTASYGSASQDLSRTDVISYAEISDTAGGIFFRQNSDDTLTNVRIVDAFRAWNGLSRQNRGRYDSPTYHGFRLATSAISDQRYDAALYWGGQGYGFKAAGAAAFVYPNEDDSDFQYDGSFSLLHENTGLNLTLSAGLVERDNQGDAQNYYAKAGWRKSFFSYGETAFGVDYTRSLNLPTGRDEGYSVGAAAVQQFEKFGTELYLLYRLHSLDRDVAPSVQDINVVSAGTRVRF